MKAGDKSHKWASASSSASRVDVALDGAVERIREQIGDEDVHILFTFVSGGHSEHYAVISRRLNSSFPGALIFGCSGGGVIGGGEELDVDTGIALLAASTPEVDWAPIYIRGGRPDDVPYTEEDILDVFGTDIENASGIILVPEAFSVNPASLIEGLNHFAPSVPVVGGLAGGGKRPGDHALFFADRVLDRGMIGLVIRGNMEVDTLVAQGCRPLGSPSFVTGCKGNVLRELDGKPALKVLRELFQKLAKEDQERFRTGLLLGIGMEEGAENYEMGDFVMRNILGIDPETENIGVSATLSTHQVVQFHVRDSRAASEDLREMLRAYRNEASEALPDGVLLFSCIGRGTGLFGVPNHDTAMFSELVGDVALGGFFGNGEIGPVRGQTYLHGFSSSFALFRAPDHTDDDME